MGITNNFKTEPLYYFAFDAVIPFPDDVITNVTFNYNNGVLASAAYDDSGSLSATYNTLAEFITALNAAQTIFVFEEVTGTQLKRTNAITTLIAVKSGSRVIPENFVSDLYIEWATGPNIDGGIQVLYPNNTSNDQLFQKLADIEAQNVISIALLEDIKTNTTP